MKKPHECVSINEVRDAIDKLDVEIIKLLGIRFGFVKEIVRLQNLLKDAK